MREEKWIEEELFSKHKPEREDLENSQPLHIAKKWEHMFWKKHQGRGCTVHSIKVYGIIGTKKPATLN